MSSGRTPRASAVRAAEYIQTKVAGEVQIDQIKQQQVQQQQQINNTNHNSTPTPNAIKLENPSQSPNNNAAPVPTSLPPRSAPSMPPPSDDEALADGGSSEDDMDGDELEDEVDEDELGAAGPPPSRHAGPFADRDDNTLTVEELKIKYGYGTSDQPPQENNDADSADERAARREAKRAKKRAKREKRRAEKERRRQERHEAAEQESEEDEEEEEEEADDKPDSKPSRRVIVPTAVVDEASDDDDGSFGGSDLDEEEEEEEEEEVQLLPALKSSRVGPRFQSDLPTLLTDAERAIDFTRMNAEPSMLEGEPSITVYVPPFESPEDRLHRLNELAERQKMQRLIAEEREARRRAHEREREEQLAREARERRKKEQARARRAEEEEHQRQAAAAATLPTETSDEADRHRKRHKVSHGPTVREAAGVGAAALPDNLPSIDVHGCITQSFNSTSVAAGGRSRYQAHYVSLFGEDSKTSKYVGIVFEREEVEEALRSGKKTFRQFLQDKVGTHL